MLPVPDRHFVDYEIHQETDWGEKLTYVTGILKDNRGKTIGYVIEGQNRITVTEAIMLTKEGKLDNVVIVENKNGTIFLRTKKNTIPEDNLTA